MSNFLILKPIKKIEGTIYLPGSKSLSNRALLLAAQSEGNTRLINFLYCDDTKYMLLALKKIGIRFFLNKKKFFCNVQGTGRHLSPKKEITLFLGNAGTAFRPLTAALCLQSIPVSLTGEKRMEERPIRHLVDSLKQGGAKILYTKKKFFPPIKILKKFQGGTITLDGSVSSQFLTSILMALPLSEHSSTILIKNTIVSQPYIKMTLSLVKKFGVYIEQKNEKTFFIRGKQQYVSPKKYVIEGDASSATYFLAAAAIKGGTVRVIGIDKTSIQGDIAFIDVLKQMGAKIKWGKNYIECSRRTLRPVNIDANHIPDAAMTLAMVALFVKKGTTLLRNIQNWRVKETDRLSAMSTELKKVGAFVQEGKNYLSITPPICFKSAIINTYNDHRIAMCFSLIALSGCSVTILNPSCVNKTFPEYFRHFASISVR